MELLDREIMTPSLNHCSICGEVARTERFEIAQTMFDCSNCGCQYVFDDPALRDTVVLASDQDRGYLRNAISRRTEDGLGPVRLSLANWRQFIADEMSRPVSLKLRIFLEAIAARTSQIGDWVTADPPFTRRVGLVSIQEQDQLAKYLESTGRIARSEGKGIVQPSYRLTIDGLRDIEPGAGRGIPGTCFVAMWFDKSLNAAYDEGICAAIERDCALRALRVDREQHNDKIDDFIMASIRSAQFVVADVTGQRQGVYFEAGWAMGLGKPVIWSCREDDVKNIHFDTRQFNHVVWSDVTELRRGIAARIRGMPSIAAKLA
jgi:nucleoside 2-deoxyribosyltransferase